MTFRFAGIQLLCGANKELNLKRAAEFIKKAVTEGKANVVCLPECFNSPYATSSFPEYAEEVHNGPSSKMLSQAAKENKIYLIGGSIPECDNGKVYNTCLIYGPDGNLIDKHRKVHLFDINIPGKITFKESDTLCPGSKGTIIKTSYGDIGIGICYDIRFPELAQIYTNKGANMIVYPGAFNMTTGPAHWLLLQRARAVDNQVYIAAISPARNPESSYQAWGHSSIIDPWGKVIASTEEHEDIIYADIDFNLNLQIKEQIPVKYQKRTDLYSINDTLPL